MTLEECERVFAAAAGPMHYPPELYMGGPGCIGGGDRLMAVFRPCTVPRPGVLSPSAQNKARRPAMIEPTIGRVVWYRPRVDRNQVFPFGGPEMAGDWDNWMKIADPDQPMTAQVVFVINPSTVNLIVHDHRGNPHAREGIFLWQGDTERPLGMRYCEWMPYQKGQAARTDAALEQLRDQHGNKVGHGG